MNKPDLYGIELVPSLVVDMESGPRPTFNSPIAANEKRFEFSNEEEDAEESFNSVNIE
jgi:hypothetical protein